MLPPSGNTPLHRRRAPPRCPLHERCELLAFRARDGCTTVFSIPTIPCPLGCDRRRRGDERLRVRGIERRAWSLGRIMPTCLRQHQCGNRDDCGKSADMTTGCRESPDSRFGLNAASAGRWRPSTQAWRVDLILDQPSWDRWAEIELMGRRTAVRFVMVTLGVPDRWRAQQFLTAAIHFCPVCNSRTTNRPATGQFFALL